MAEPTCLTCIKIINQAAAVSISDSGSAQSALSKHFWFNENEIHNGILCQPCWSKIDDFHQFYCEIERIQATEPYKIPAQYLVVKQEAAVTTDETECAVEAGKKVSSINNDGQKEQANCEITVAKESSSLEGTSQNLFNGPDSSDEKTVQGTTEGPLQKLRKIIENDELIVQHVKLECDTCSKKCNSYQDLQRHSMTQHEKLATVFCCGRKFTRKYRLVDHIQFHLNPTQFQCDVCTKQFSSGEKLLKHKDKVHTSEKDKVFQCSVCPKSFARRTLLNSHEQNYHGTTDEQTVETPQESSDDETSQNESDPDYGEKVKQKPPTKQKKTSKMALRPAESTERFIRDEKFISENINLECHTCSQKCASFQELQKHCSSKHGKSAFVFCCGQKFSRRPRLIDHIQFHLNPTQFQCDICSKQFPHSEGLKRHMDSRHAQEEEKTLQCSVCPKTFARQRLLYIHEKYHQKLNDRKFQCTTCNKLFVYESQLQEHVGVHGNEFKYVCHVCAKGYYLYTSYTSHMKIHDEDPNREKPKGERWQCTECDTWIYKRDMRKHMLRHSGSQTCDQCGQECRSEMALRYHKAQHRKRDLTCSVCGKTFKRPISLKEHMASHTGDRLYNCDFCEKTFNSNANCAAHRKKMHPKEWLEDKMKKNPNLSLDHASASNSAETQSDKPKWWNEALSLLQ